MHQLHHQTKSRLPSRAAARIAALRRRAWLAGDAFLAALDRYRALRAKEFDPNQPRVPAGSPEGGQWTNGEAGGGGWPVFDFGPIDLGPIDLGPAELAPLAAAAGIGHNRGPLLDEPPQIPKEPPADRTSRLAKAKEAAKWLATFGARRIPQVAAALAAVEAADWLRAEWPSIRSYRDPARTMDELLASAREPRPGYHRHHIVEQTWAERDGFPRSRIDSPGNIVSVPIYKHHQITGWYAQPNPKFGGLSPREFLKGKDWQTRSGVGRDALRRYGVLK